MSGDANGVNVVNGPNSTSSSSSNGGAKQSNGGGGGGGVGGGGRGRTKYVPPALRNQNGSAGRGGKSSFRDDPHSNHSDGGYNRRGGGGGGYNGGSSRGYGGGRGGSYNNNSGFFGGNNGRGGYRNERFSMGSGGAQRGFGGGGYGGRSFNLSRKNELGFHGDMKPSGLVESRLFGDVKNTGINFDKYDEIPVETSGRNCPSGIETFEEMDLPESLRQNLERTNFAKPTPVQKFSMPIGMMGRDMMACAQTGSGKTGGFLFPVITMLLKEGPAAPPDKYAGRSRPPAFPSALIIAPTRELASQINEEAEKFSYLTGLACVVIYGGANVRSQLQEIDRGCDILTATPGRLVDLLDRGRISLSCIKFLVLDEADRMLDMGFEPQIRRIVEEDDMPWDERRTFMFSATFPKEIQRLAADFLRDYVFLTVGRVGSAAKDIMQKVEFVDERDKTPYLIQFLNTVESGLVLVFVETKRAADALEYALQGEGYPSTSIHGDRTQAEREEALQLFKEGKAPILVATDVASRGLDIDNVMFVINYDLPSNIDDYVHRIGRTGRAGNQGMAISLFCDKNSNIAKDLAELLEENGQEVPDWLSAMTRRGGNRFGGGGSGGGGRGRGRGRGGSRFGGRDFRRGDGPGPSSRGYAGGVGGYQDRAPPQARQPRDAW